MLKEKIKKWHLKTKPIGSLQKIAYKSLISKKD